MNFLLVGFVSLGAAAIFLALVLSRRAGRPSNSIVAAQWASGMIALLGGTYVLLFLNSFTIVTVTSRCPDYAGLVSAGELHNRLISFNGTDYFMFADDFEGEIKVEGRKGTLMSYGYITTVGIERLDVHLDEGCQGQAEQMTLA